MITYKVADGIALAKKATKYSQLISLEGKDVHPMDDAAATAHATLGVAAQGVHASTGTGTITVTLEGSVDGANFESGTAVLSSIASDGAHDHASLIVDFYPFYRAKLTEDNVNPCTGLNVWIAFA